MTDHTDFAAAIAATPDNDLPRLVFADWLEEHGEPDRAEFIRAQIRLASCPPWDPFAVLCRHRRIDWLRGDRWWGTLPKVNSRGIEWHSDRAFRRGFGWAIIARDVRYLLEIGPRLFSEAPIGELHLPTATLDEWRAFARAEWLPRVRSVRFYGKTTPIEAIRELMASQRSTGIEEIVFARANGAGLPELLADLAESPLGRQLRRLEFHSGPFNANLLIETIADADWPNLLHLALTNFGADKSALRGAIRSRCLRRLTSLLLADFHVGGPGQSMIDQALLSATDSDLGIADFQLNNFGLSCRCLGLFAPAVSLARLDISDNFDLHGVQEATTIDKGTGFASLKSLSLRLTGMDDHFLRGLVDSQFWPNLVELNLRDNSLLTEAGIEHLLRAPIPPDLTALLLTNNLLGDTTKTKLRQHFGERVIL